MMDGVTTFGSLPSELGQLSDLTSFSFDSFCGSIPTEVSAMTGSMESFFIGSGLDDDGYPNPCPTPAPSTTYAPSQSPTYTQSPTETRFPTPAPSVSQDKLILSSLYSSLGGSSWGCCSYNGWMSGDPCASSWGGVGCDGGAVTELSLNSLGVTAVVPTELGLLTDLTELQMR